MHTLRGFFKRRMQFIDRLLKNRRRHFFAILVQKNNLDVPSTKRKSLYPGRLVAVRGLYSAMKAAHQREDIHNMLLGDDLDATFDL